MPNTFTSNVFSSTYKDDFKDSDNYHRILFNSGRALQARELTQLQTLIQEEIGRFGRNIFKEGAAVNPGGPTISNDYEFIKLTTATYSLPQDPQDLVGTILTGPNINDASGIQVRVLEFVAATSTDPATIYVQYVNTSAGDSGTDPIRMAAGNVMTNVSLGFTLQVANAVGTELPVGRGCKISNAEGDFFTRGHFVFTKGQSIILSKYTRYPTKVVGFKVTEDIVTVSDNTALYDNQGATPNLSSPGADRYRIQLTLTTKDAVADDENFVYYCDVFEGNIVDQVKGTEDYNKINDTLAKRTQEESGNYIVNPFTVDFSDSGTNIIASVSDGVAYVNGYRGATEKPTSLIIPKPRATGISENEVSGISYGQYFLVAAAEFKLHRDTNTFERVRLTDTVNGAGTTLGHARIRYIEKDGSNYRVYVFDIQMKSGESLRNIKSIGLGGSNHADVLLENSKAVLKESQKTNLVYALPNPRPRVLSDFDFEVQRLFTTSQAGTTHTETLSVNGETWTNTSDWIVVNNSTGAVVTGASANGTATNSTVVSGLPSGVACSVYAKVNKASPVVRQKTLVDTTVTAAVTTDSDGVPSVKLGLSDIFEVEEIKQTNSAGADISHLFTVDNGQRAGYYGNGRLVLETGATAPSGNVYAKLKHFTHGAGDFFAVNSYTGQVEYEKIPSFQTGVRTSVNLRDVVDFRSTVNSSGAFGGINELPSNGDIFQADVEYYLPRADKIVVTTQGEVKNIQGEAGFGAQIPATPENTLALFNLEHNAYGLNDSDVVVQPIKAKRFTMSDISRMEKRIDNLEEVTSLSLLELDTSSLLVLDADGNARTKSGFFVDNYADRSFSDVGNPEYRAAIDPSRGLLGVPTADDNVILAYDSSLSTNTVMKGDTVYLNYTDSATITQTLISGTENVNPFAVITGEGNITLSPSTDNWFQTKYNPANVINQTATENVDVNLGDKTTFLSLRPDAANRFKWSQQRRWVPIPGLNILNIPALGGWRGQGMWNWHGVPNNDVRIVDVGTGNGGNRSQNADFNVIRSFSQRVVVGEKTVRKVVGDRTVSLTFLPFIRSRKVFFKAQGLRPNTKYFPFFDGTLVSDFCREETFKRYGAMATDVSFANANRLATAHPQGSSTLEADANGAIEGSFFIPSSETLRFRAGTREFKLLDISKNDDAAALSRASFNYTAQGTLDTRQKTITSTRITQTRTRRWTETTRVKVTDPLAQSFFVTSPSGIYVTKVQTYFKTKDADGVPIQLQIRPMVNGAPSSTEIHSQSIKFLAPSQVNTPASETQAAVVAAPTTFEFDEPIFLNPEEEYAIVLLAESTQYQAYVGETYAFELGSTEKRISRQPSMGSLFKSQNGTTWEPDQTKDMAFKIFTADFVSSGTAVFENRDVEKEQLVGNPLYMSADHGADSDQVTLAVSNHGFNVNDKVNVEGLVANTTYNGVKGSSINGERTITAVDGFGIRFDADSAATSSGRFGAELIKIDKQLQFDIVTPSFTTLLPDDTLLTYRAKYTTGKSLAASAGSQVKYQKDGTFSNDVIINDENTFNAPRLIANPSNETAELGTGQRSATFSIDMSTTRSSVSPVIDTQTASLSLQSNMIDNQAAAAANGFNVPLGYSAETNAFGGSSLAKHITSVANLEESAVGMKVLLAVSRPAGSNIQLYYRVANDGQDILDINWTEQTIETPIAPDEKNFREYRYLVGGDGGTLDPFTQYQFKIVFTGNNTSKVPFVRDFRAIAMAT